MNQIDEAQQLMKQVCDEANAINEQDGYFNEEMAEILSCPVSTIKSRVYTALELLKVELAPMKARGLS